MSNEWQDILAFDKNYRESLQQATSPITNFGLRSAQLADEESKRQDALELVTKHAQLQRESASQIAREKANLENQEELGRRGIPATGDVWKDSGAIQTSKNTSTMVDVKSAINRMKALNDHSDVLYGEMANAGDEKAQAQRMQNGAKAMMLDAEAMGALNEDKQKQLRLYAHPELKDTEEYKNVTPRSPEEFYNEIAKSAWLGIRESAAQKRANKFIQTYRTFITADAQPSLKTSAVLQQIAGKIAQNNVDLQVAHTLVNSAEANGYLSEAQQNEIQAYKQKVFGMPAAPPGAAQVAPVQAFKPGASGLKAPAAAGGSGGVGDKSGAASSAGPGVESGDDDSTMLSRAIGRIPSLPSGRDIQNWSGILYDTAAHANVADALDILNPLHRKLQNRNPGERYQPIPTGTTPAEIFSLGRKTNAGLDAQPANDNYTPEQIGSYSDALARSAISNDALSPEPPSAVGQYSPSSPPIPTIGGMLSNHILNRQANFPMAPTAQPDWQQPTITPGRPAPAQQNWSQVTPQPLNLQPGASAYPASGVNPIAMQAGLKAAGQLLGTSDPSVLADMKRTYMQETGESETQVNKMLTDAVRGDPAAKAKIDAFKARYHGQAVGPAPIPMNGPEDQYQMPQPFYQQQ